MPSGAVDPSPIASLEENVFFYHRRTTPYGVGWGIGNVSHAYKNPSVDEIVLVSGAGDQEFFAPRTRAIDIASHGIGAQCDARSIRRRFPAAGVLVSHPACGLAEP